MEPGLKGQQLLGEVFFFLLHGNGRGTREYACVCLKNISRSMSANISLAKANAEASLKPYGGRGQSSYGGVGVKI